MPAKPYNPDGPFTTGQLSRAFGVAPRTVALWCDDEILDCYVLPGGSHRRISRAALEAFLARNPTLPRPEFLGYNRPPSSTEGNDNVGPVSQTEGMDHD